MVNIQPTVKTTGPIFDGRARAAVDDFLDAAEVEVADEGANDIRQQLGSVLKNPTGFYESQIQTERQRNDTMVTDGGVIYGPWLEGTSSRNQTTRFKGYRTFRLIAQRLQGKADDIAGRILPQFVRRM